MIPVYNGARFVRQAIDSVLAQSTPADELIVLDNQSTDGTYEIALAYGDRREVRVEQNAENIGAVPNWVRIAERARGDYLMWLPADDFLTPDCVERWASVAERHPEVGLYLAAYTQVNEAGEPMAMRRRPPLRTGLIDGRELVDWLLVNGQPNVVPGTVVKRSEYEAVGGFDLRLRGAMDYDLYVRLAGRGPVYVDPLPNAFSRDHAAQWSKDVYFHDNSDSDVLFDKIAELPFLTERQARLYVEGLCDYSRQYFMRPLRDPRADSRAVLHERERYHERLRRWRDSDKPYARYVRFWPRRARPLAAWLLGSTRLGIWALRRLTGPVARGG